MTMSLSLFSAIAEEILSGVRTVLAFNAQKFECQRYAEPIRDGYIAGVRKVDDKSSAVNRLDVCRLF